MGARRRAKLNPSEDRSALGGQLVQVAGELPLEPGRFIGMNESLLGGLIEEREGLLGAGLGLVDCGGLAGALEGGTEAGAVAPISLPGQVPQHHAFLGAFYVRHASDPQGFREPFERQKI